FVGLYGGPSLPSASSQTPEKFPRLWCMTRAVRLPRRTAHLSLGPQGQSRLHRALCLNRASAARATGRSAAAGEIVASDADGRPNFARLNLLRWVKQSRQAGRDPWGDGMLASAANTQRPSS